MIVLSQFYFQLTKASFLFFCFVWFNWSWQRVKFVSGPQLSNSIGFGNSIFLRVSALTPAMTNRSVAEPNQSPSSFRITSQYQLMQVTHQSTLKVILNTIDLLMKRKTGVRQPHWRNWFPKRYGFQQPRFAEFFLPPLEWRPQSVAKPGVPPTGRLFCILWHRCGIIWPCLDIPLRIVSELPYFLSDFHGHGFNIIHDLLQDLNSIIVIIIFFCFRDPFEW